MNLLEQKMDQLSTVDIGLYDSNFATDLRSSGTQLITIRDALKSLIALYERTGFLYPEKKKRISPYMDLILDNWEAALKMDDQLLNIVRFRGNSTIKEQLTSITLWRTTYNSWVAQHLVSTGFPAGVCAMMLRAQAEVNIERHRYKSFQNWFSESNQYANMVFGTLVKTIGKKHSDIKLYTYVGVKQSLQKKASTIQIIPYQSDMNEELYHFYTKIRGRIDADAEEMDHQDIELDQLDQLYQKVGLRRKRYVWLAMTKNKTRPVGAVVVNRAPFGLNFSLLENRCDLLVDPDIPQETREMVCHQLLSEVMNAYFDQPTDMLFPISFVPVLTDSLCGNLLIKTGATFIRCYYKSIWVKQAFEKWYTHIQKTYDKFLTKRKPRK